MHHLLHTATKVALWYFLVLKLTELQLVLHFILMLIVMELFWGNMKTLIQGFNG